MEHHQSILPVTLLTAVVILVAGGLGYYIAYSKYGTGNSATNNMVTPVVTNSTATPTAVTTPQATSTTAVATEDGSTTSWETYATANSFRIQPPAEYNAQVKNETLILENKNNPADSVTITAESTTLNLEQYIADLKQSSLVSGEQKTTLDGKVAYEAIDQGLVNTYGVYTIANGRAYRLTFGTNRKDSLAELKSGLSSGQKQIMSSFEFIQ